MVPLVKGTSAFARDEVVICVISQSFTLLNAITATALKGTQTLRHHFLDVIRV